MRVVRRLLVLALLLALVVSGAALAARGDPQKKITPADQARAKAMLLRTTDVGPGYKATRSSSGSDDFYCAALDESDLTLTGEAESPNFETKTVFLSSMAQVYESVADANVSWRRGTSASGERCLRKELSRDGGLVSFRKRAFPRLAQRSVAYRFVGSAQGIRFYLDFVVLQQSRAHAVLAYGSVLVPVPGTDQVRLARIVAGRMSKAMRGA